MFLRKANKLSYLYQDFRKIRFGFQINQIIKNIGYKPFVNFEKFERTDKSSSKSLYGTENRELLDKQVLRSICGINSEMNEKKIKLIQLSENNINTNNKFIFNPDILHSYDLENLLNYYLYNQENFNQEELDYFIYVFCSKAEMTNKTKIKSRNLIEHKSINLIWDYFLNNYKKINNIDDANKFLYLFFIYHRKFSLKKDEYAGKYFNKNNKKFFLNSIEKYIRLNLKQINTGKLLNILTLYGSFKTIHYYEFLRDREDDIENLSYWTLRRLIVRLTLEMNNEKNLRQIFNFILNPMTRDLTSLNIQEKGYLLKNISVMDNKVILLSCLDNLKEKLFDEIIRYLDELPENFEINIHNIRLFLNIFQTGRYYEKIAEDDRLLNGLNKFLKSFDIIYENLSKKENATIEDGESDEFTNESSKININSIIEDNNTSINKKEVSKSDDMNSNLRNDKLKDEGFFDNELEEINELDLKLRIINKKEEEDLEFLNVENFEGFGKTSKIGQDIFNIDSLEMFFKDEKNADVFKENDKFEEKKEEFLSDLFSSKLSKIDNLISSQNFDGLENEQLKDLDFLQFDLNLSDSNIAKLDEKIFRETNELEIVNQNKKEEIQIKYSLNKSVLCYNSILIFHNFISIKHPLFRKNKELAISIIERFKKIIFEMDLNIYKKKFQRNLIFSVFTLMLEHDIKDREIYNFLIENFTDEMINNIFTDHFLSFLDWIEKYLTVAEKKKFIDKTSKCLLMMLSKDYSLYNFFRVVNIITSLNRKRTIFTDNLHFEFISFLSYEMKIEILVKLFNDYLKIDYKYINIDYTRNLLTFLLNNIKIQELDLISNISTKVEFYFSLLLLDTDIFDKELDKKTLKLYNDLINYIETRPFFEFELFVVVKSFYKTFETYKNNCDRAVKIFFEKLENLIVNNRILLEKEIDKFLMYFALTLIQKNSDKSLIEKAVYLCDKLFSKNKSHLEFNISESLTGVNKLLKLNIVCRSLIKNFLVNIQIYKRLKESDNFKLDDQTDINVNLINFKYNNVEKNKNIINEVLEKLRDNQIISQEIYQISFFK